MIEEEFDNRQIKVDYANKMKKLMKNDEFKSLFLELYVDAYVMTNIGNLWMYDDPARRRFVEKSLARSHFLHFVDDTIEEGRQADMSLREAEEEIATTEN